jgi:hypothetical protein
LRAMAPLSFRETHLECFLRAEAGNTVKLIQAERPHNWFAIQGYSQ